MASKADLLRLIVDELIAAQTGPGEVDKSPERVGPLQLPPELAIGDGRFLAFSVAGLNHVKAYADVVVANAPLLQTAMSREESFKFVSRAFGVAFAEVYAGPIPSHIYERIDELVDRQLANDLNTDRFAEDFILGCWLLTGPGTDELQVGPVQFVKRELWLQREEDAGIIPKVTARRLKARWRGKRLRKRKDGGESMRERALAESIGECPTVCVVATKGLAPKVAEEKALVAARLAMTVVALIWETPSRALERMGLLYDGAPYSRSFAGIANGRVSRSSFGVSGIRGQFVTEGWPEHWSSLDWLLGPLGQTIAEYVQLSEQPQQSELMNALFHSLRWFQEACRTESSLLATVKFAASMDALAGGMQRRGIVDLIESRMGIAPGSPLMKDGRTADQVIKRIYDYARSRTIHGNNPTHTYDWTEVRGLAQLLARRCLVDACIWISENPTSDGIDALRRP